VECFVKINFICWLRVLLSSMSVLIFCLAVLSVMKSTAIPVEVSITSTYFAVLLFGEYPFSVGQSTFINL
jgi:hypothetical protein